MPIRAEGKATGKAHCEGAWDGLQAIRLALEGKEREKEMVARLLRDLSSDLLTRDQVAFGFTRLLSTAEVHAPLFPQLMTGRLSHSSALPKHTASRSSLVADMKESVAGMHLIVGANNFHWDPKRQQHSKPEVPQSCNLNCCQQRRCCWDEKEALKYPPHTCRT